MPEGQILDFIRSSVKTVWALELLLFLRRNAKRAWSHDELVLELRSSRNIVNESINIFVQAGVVREEEGGFRYGPAAVELDWLIEQLAQQYAERPTTVVNAIVQAQSGKLQDFANAFRIKRD